MRPEVTQAQKEYRKFDATRQRAIRILTALFVAIVSTFFCGMKLAKEDCTLLLLSIGMLVVYTIVAIVLCSRLARRHEELYSAAYGKETQMPRTGLFAQLWEEFEDKQFEGWFDGKIAFSVAHNNCIDLTIVRNKHEFSILIDKDLVSILADEETDHPAEVEIPLSELSGIPHFLSTIQEIMQRHS